GRKSLDRKTRALPRFLIALAHFIHSRPDTQRLRPSSGARSRFGKRRLVRRIPTLQLPFAIFLRCGCAKASTRRLQRASSVLLPYGKKPTDRKTGTSPVRSKTAACSSKD